MVGRWGDVLQDGTLWDFLRHWGKEMRRKAWRMKGEFVLRRRIAVKMGELKFWFVSDSVGFCRVGEKRRSLRSGTRARCAVVLEDGCADDAWTYCLPIWRLGFALAGAGMRSGIAEVALLIGE